MAKDEVHQFTCGHSATLKVNLFGRGAARQKRITEYFNRNCLDCAVVAVPVMYATLTMTNEHRTCRVAEVIAKLPSAYRMTEN